MAININDNFSANAGKAIDVKYGKTVQGKTVPYVSTTEANAAINVNYRYKGLTVLIDDGSGPQEYWYKNSVSNDGLVEKPTGARVFSGGDGFVPEGGWQIGDYWYYTNNNGFAMELRQVTDPNTETFNFNQIAILQGDGAFNLDALDGNNTVIGGNSTYLNATPETEDPNPPYEIDLNVTIANVSKSPSTNAIYEFKETGAISFALNNSNGQTLAKSGSITTAVQSSATDPTIDQVGTGFFSAWKNTTSGALKLWVNDNGILKSIAFS